MNITPFQQVCITYLTNLRTTHQHALATAELSLRADLEAFLKQAAELANRPVQMIGEAKKLAVGKQIVVTLSETIRLMAAIDEWIPGFPIQ